MAPDPGPSRGYRVTRDPQMLAALAVAVVIALGFGLVVPVLPLFARAFGVGLFAVTLVVSVFAAVRLVSNLYTGALTDRVGAPRAIGWGALLVSASSLLTAVAPGYWWLVAFRGAGGFGSALFFNALLTLVIRTAPVERRGRAVGLLQGAFLFGVALGPSVGGLLAEPLGLRWPFVIYALCCAGAGLVALTFLPRPQPGGPDGQADAARGLAAMWRSARSLCADQAFVAALVMMAASRWAATGVRFSLIPVFAAEVVGASASVVGFALTLAAVTHLLLLWPAGRVTDTVGRKALTVPSFLLFAVVAMAVTWATTVPAFLVVMALYGMGSGLTAVTPPVIAGDVVPPERTGVSIGLLNTAGDLGSVLGPLASGFLAQTAGYGWGYGASAALLAAAGLYALRMRETMPRRGDPGAA